MKTRTRRRRAKTAPPLMVAQLMAASAETIARRTAMMWTGTCSPAEYRRMVHEKSMAAAASATRLLAGGGVASVTSLLSPWHKRATANARRLRKRPG